MGFGQTPATLPEFHLRQLKMLFDARMSPVGPKSPLQRIKAPVRYTSSSSLSGMEKVSPLSSTAALVTPDSIVSDIDKPLPAPPKSLSPRKSSSVYSLHAKAAEARMTNTKDELLLHPDTRLLPSRAYSAKPEVRQPERQKLMNLAGSESKSDPLLGGDAMYQHKKGEHARSPERPRNQDDITLSRAHKALPKPASLGIYETQDTAKNEAQGPTRRERTGPVLKGTDRKSIIIVPTSMHSVTEATNPDRFGLAGSMSPRITDVIDHTLVPSPLHVDAGDVSPTERSGRPPRFGTRSSSYCSSASSHSSISSIIDSYLMKSRRTTEIMEIRTKPGRRKYSFGSPQKGRKGSQTSSTFSRLSSSFMTTKSRLGSVASHRRRSVQRSIDNIYDTLTNFSLAPKAVPPLHGMNPHKKGIPKECRSPAIPVTAYQMYGRKAWEMEKEAKSPKKRRFRISSKGKKPSPMIEVFDKSKHYEPLRYSTIMNPPQTAPLPPASTKNYSHSVMSDDDSRSRKKNGKTKKPMKPTKVDKMREELKKKIVVIGIGEGRPTAEGPWI